ncbi:MAG: lipocalin family protein [bacterium]
MKKLIFLGLFLFSAGCVGIPGDLKAVDGFDINKFTGTWYEIIRLDNKFEKGLTNVSATYTLRKDGGIDIVNNGFNIDTKKWVSVKGKAYFVSSPGTGRLKVSFSWPFYTGYNIIFLDKENYSYALVCGNNKSYFWILARDMALSIDRANELIDVARNLDFDVDKCVIVDQDIVFKRGYFK